VHFPLRSIVPAVHAKTSDPLNSPKFLKVAQGGLWEGEFALDQMTEKMIGTLGSKQRELLGGEHLGKLLHTGALVQRFWRCF